MSMQGTVERIELSTAHAFTIARGGGSAWQNVFVTLRDAECTAYGEGAPRSYYHEDPVEAARSLEAWFASGHLVEGGMPVECMEGFAGPQSAHAALDIAYHDLEAQRRSIHVTELLHTLYELEVVNPEPMSSFTIGIDTTEVMLRKVEEARSYPILKVKLGTDRDLEIVRAIRSVSAAEIRVDANAAWSVEETIEKTRALSELGVTIVEQPLPADDIEGYGALKGRSALPIVLDESIKTSVDVERFARVTDAINIKLSKSGGLAEAANMIRVARHHRLQVMVGCFIESSVAISAACALAPYVDILDVDGAALLAHDPFHGATIPAGRIRQPAGHGLGLTRL